VRLAGFAREEVYVKKYLPAAVLMLALLTGTSIGLAQDTTTTTTTTTQPSSNVQILFVACADRSVISLSGFMEPGFDVYYQVFSAAGGGGNAISGLRRVQVNGDYTFGETFTFPAGTTLAASAIGSTRVYIAREGLTGTPSNDTLVDTVDDLQDGCTSSQPAGNTSVDLGGGSTGAEAAAAGPANPQPDILLPGGGVLNNNRIVEDPVEIGVRQSDVYRSDTPGMIFAECDQYPEALPGIIYDSDNVVIFWSWFAKTNDTMAQHLANANYAVRMNSAPLPNAQATAPAIIRRDVWVFYTVPVGNLRPGHYEVDFQLTWNQPISDGYDEYGPGTANESVRSLCNFDVVRNPSGINIVPNVMFNPTAGPVHDITPQF
jgi:hypothetical protein